MSKEYILTACEPIPDSVVGLRGHPMALNIPNPRWKQITLTSVEIELLMAGLMCSISEQSCFDSEHLYNKLQPLIDDNPLDLRDCKAQIDPEYKARHDE